MLGLSVIVASAIIFSGLITVLLISYGSLDEGLEKIREATDDRYERGLEEERTNIKIMNASINSESDLYINVTNNGETVLNSSKFKIDVVYEGDIVTEKISENEMLINGGINSLVWTPGSILRIVADNVDTPNSIGKVVVITENGIKAFSKTGDNEKPIFSADMSDKTAETDSTANFLIQVWDNIGVDTVTLTYNFEGDPETDLVMNKNANNLWDTNIDIPINSDKNIYYHITAKDEQGNEVREPSNGEKIVKVYDTISPISDDGSGDFTINNGTSFTIYANFTDNIDVTTAKIFHKRNNTDSWVGNLMTEGIEGKFNIDNSTMNIDTKDDTTDYFYFVIAYDDNGNSVQYPVTCGSYKIVVN